MQSSSDVDVRLKPCSPFRKAQIGYAIFLAVSCALCSSNAIADPAPWAPRKGCHVKPRGVGGLVAPALEALKKVEVDHRITQTINPKRVASNYHGPDQIINGRSFTAAVDLSVNCLGEDDIKRLLSGLTDAGFVAWYRQDGKDSWKGDKHIHAVLAAEPLKPQLQRQVASWLGGRTGLVGDASYKFWQPSESQKLAVQRAYQASRNGS